MEAVLYCTRHHGAGLGFGLMLIGIGFVILFTLLGYLLAEYNHHHNGAHKTDETGEE